MNKSIEVNGVSVLIFRVCLSGIFITAGISPIIQPEKVAGCIHSSSFQSFTQFFGAPNLLAIFSGFTLLASGIALLLGVLTGWSILFLFLVLIPITITIQMDRGLVSRAIMEKCSPIWRPNFFHHQQP
ncbi:hypothetical protein D3C84_538890 [compost metagenome]